MIDVAHPNVERASTPSPGAAVPLDHEREFDPTQLADVVADDVDWYEAGSPTRYTGHDQVFARRGGFAGSARGRARRGARRRRQPRRLWPRALREG